MIGFVIAVVWYLVVATLILFSIDHVIKILQKDIKELKERVNQLEGKHNGKCKCIQHS